MKSMIKLYLVIRKAVLFMARPLFYLIAIAVIFAAITVPGSKSAISIATVELVGMIPDFLNWLMLGHGRETPDLLLMLSVIFPSLIALSWMIMERVTGIHYLLKRNHLIK